MAKPSSRRSRSIVRSAEPLVLLACCLPLMAAAQQGVPAAPAAASPAIDMPLYLEVELNRQPAGELLPFVSRGGRLFASGQTLAALGLVLPDLPPGQLTALDQLPGVQFRYDAALQRLEITAPLSLLQLETTRIDASRQEVPAASNSPGLLLNYDFYGSHGNGASNLTAYGELRAFGGHAGVFSTTAVTRAFRDGGSGWQGDSVRLDSQWQLSFPRSMLSLTVGDTYSGNLGWSRAVRLGGIRFGRDFSLQPYRVTTPLPTFLGEVAVPSEVDLYINGVRQYSGELPVGPFQLATQPNFNGLGNAQLVVTDAFGAVRTIEFPFYAAQDLLAGGLSDWSVAAGVVREDYGLESFSYASRPVASGNLRYGVSDSLTLEAHGETGDDLRNGGLGAVWGLGRAGVVNVSHARSRHDGASGSQTAWGYSWSNTRFNLSLASQRSHGDYRDLASLYGRPPPRTSERALVGWNSARLGSFGATWLHQRYPDEEASRYASAFWNRNFGQRWSLSFNLNQNLDDSDDRSAYLGISVRLGDRRSLSTSIQRNGERDSINADLGRTAPSAGGLSWRVRAGRGEGSSTGLAEAGWLGDHGRLTGGVAHSGGDWQGYAGASGGLVLMSGDVFASRSISDAFAVVSTDGATGVPVKLENRLVGTTNDNGLLLVTPLNAWQRNRLAIDPLDLPADLRLGQVEQFAVPTDRAGTRVAFQVTPVRSAIVVIHTPDGTPVEPGSIVRPLDGGNADAFVGYDGEVYLDAVAPHNVLRISTPGRTCTVTFDYPADPGPIPRIGPLACQPEETP
jgi:outer membrane usher protein